MQHLVSTAKVHTLSTEILPSVLARKRKHMKQIIKNRTTTLSASAMDVCVESRSEHSIFRLLPVDFPPNRSELLGPYDKLPRLRYANNLFVCDPLISYFSRNSMEAPLDPDEPPKRVTLECFSQAKYGKVDMQ